MYKGSQLIMWKIKKHKTKNLDHLYHIFSQTWLADSKQNDWTSQMYLFPPSLLVIASVPTYTEMIDAMQTHQEYLMHSERRLPRTGNGLAKRRSRFWATFMQFKTHIVKQFGIFWEFSINYKRVYSSGLRFFGPGWPRILLANCLFWQKQLSAC